MRIGLAFGLSLMSLAGTAQVSHGTTPAKPQRLSPEKAKSNAKPVSKPPAHPLSSGAIRSRRSSNPSSIVTKSAVIQKQTAGLSHSVRPLGPPRTPAPMLNKVRHCSPNPAVISGSSALSTKSNGAIEGRQVYRRP